MKRGLFISIEGIEGSGKSTLVENLAKSIESKRACLCTREPGGSAKAEKIRELVLADSMDKMDSHAELLLMYAARRQHIVDTIEPALSKGVWVLCDRFVDASYAYQAGGRNISKAVLKDLDKWIVASTMPDITLLLDAPVKQCVERIKLRSGNNRFDNEKYDFHNNVREMYLELAFLNGDRIKVIDASASTMDVLEQCLEVIYAYDKASV